MWGELYGTQALEASIVGTKIHALFKASPDIQQSPPEMLTDPDDLGRNSI